MAASRIEAVSGDAELDQFCDRVATWATRHTPRYARALVDGIAQALEAGSHRATGGGGITPFDESHRSTR